MNKKTLHTSQRTPVNRNKNAYVSFKDVSKIYHTGDVEVAAVDDISFEIGEGELVLVIGPSGSGKTTTLNMLGGMDTVTSGAIRLDEISVDLLSKKELVQYRREDIGFVFQFYNLVQNLTTLENVELASQICKDPLDATQCLVDVGLGERLHNFPAQLSGGEQQRVAIARALAKNPKLLLCDEPTGALDYKTGKKVLKLLQDTCKKSKKTVIIITHNTALEPIGDKIIKMNSGKVSDIVVNKNPVSVDSISW